MSIYSFVNIYYFMANLNCSDKPIEELRFAVLKKYGKIYGVLKKEVNAALKQRAIKINDEINNIATEDTK